MDGVIHMHTTTKRGLKFYGTEGTWDVYRYFKGGRPIFEAAVDTTDPELKIYVGKVNAVWAKVNDIKDETFTGELFETKGRAHRTQDGNRISSDSMKSYVNMRAFSIFANLYVPKPATVTDAEAMDDTDN